MQYSSLPNFATFKEIIEKPGEIVGWAIDQPASSRNPNSRIAFNTKDGKTYLVMAWYNEATKQIFPPIEVPEPKQSLINWKNAYKIIADPEKATPPIANGYCDTEINGKVPPNYFDPIFQSIDSFKYDRYNYYCTMADTHNDEQPALVRQWSNEDKSTRIQLWITSHDDYDDGWYIVYGSPETFLAVGGYNSHPFVVAPAFTFDNSDGSTDEDFDFPTLNLDQVKNILKTKSYEYVFDQHH